MALYRLITSSLIPYYLKRTSVLEHEAHTAYCILLCSSLLYPPSRSRTLRAFANNEPPQPEACKFSISRCSTSALRWQWVNQGNPCGELRAGNGEVPFDLPRIAPTSADLVISGDATLRNILSGRASTPAAPSRRSSIAYLPQHTSRVHESTHFFPFFLAFVRSFDASLPLRHDSLFVLRFDGWCLMGRFISATISGP